MFKCNTTYSQKEKCTFYEIVLHTSVTRVYEGCLKCLKRINN